MMETADRARDNNWIGKINLFKAVIFLLHFRNDLKQILKRGENERMIHSRDSSIREVVQKLSKNVAYQKLKSEFFFFLLKIIVFLSQSFEIFYFS